MKLDGEMLSTLANRELSLAIRGADEAKSEGDPKDGKEESKDEKSEGSEKEGDQKDNRTLSEADWKIWNNFQEERIRVHGARTKAEEERDEAKRQLADLKAKGATDDDAKGQITTLTQERDALQETVAQLRKQVAFLREPGYDWVDPDAALRLADLSTIEIDKSGNVQGMKIALDALMKAKPYLIRKKSEDEDKDENKGAPKSGDPASQAKNKNTDKDRQAREQRLRAKYPALRR